MYVVEIMVFEEKSDSYVALGTDTSISGIVSGFSGLPNDQDRPKFKIKMDGCCPNSPPKRVQASPPMR